MAKSQDRALTLSTPPVLLTSKPLTIALVRGLCLVCACVRSAASAGRGKHQLSRLCRAGNWSLCPEREARGEERARGTGAAEAGLQGRCAQPGAGEAKGDGKASRAYAAGLRFVDELRVPLAVPHALTALQVVHFFREVSHESRGLQSHYI